MTNFLVRLRIRHARQSKIAMFGIIFPQDGHNIMPNSVKYFCIEQNKVIGVVNFVCNTGGQKTKSRHFIRLNKLLLLQPS